VINRMIDDYVEQNRNKAISFTSMGQLRYLSAIKHVQAVVGNSSSGIIEAPSFEIPTVNIGDRQKGRVRAESVIDCEPEKENISMALEKALSEEFRLSIQAMRNLYEQEGTAKSIKETIKNHNLWGILKKDFYDITFDG